jgi:hypothetical protein
VLYSYKSDITRLVGVKERLCCIHTYKSDITRLVGVKERLCCIHKKVT